MIKVNVILNNIIWKKYLKDPHNFINKKIELLNKKNQLFKKNNLICSLLLSGTKEIKKLNKKFRKKNRSTDVLSFPFYEKINKKIETGEIEIAPLAFMRGRTLKNSFAILDEAQNATLTQIKMFLTRIGENSKLVVNGDPSQIDLINKSQSGLIKTKKILNKIT